MPGHPLHGVSMPSLTRPRRANRPSLSAAYRGYPPRRLVRLVRRRTKCMWQAPSPFGTAQPSRRKLPRKQRRGSWSCRRRLRRRVEVCRQSEEKRNAETELLRLMRRLRHLRASQRRLRHMQAARKRRSASAHYPRNRVCCGPLPGAPTLRWPETRRRRRSARSRCTPGRRDCLRSTCRTRVSQGLLLHRHRKCKRMLNTDRNHHRTRG